MLGWTTWVGEWVVLLYMERDGTAQADLCLLIFSSITLPVCEAREAGFSCVPADIQL
jgi:hypothetical protein